MSPSKSLPLVLAGCLLSTACTAAHDVSVTDDAGLRDAVLPDAAPPVSCTEGAREERKVDLLFVIDNSGSMKEEQQQLLAELPRIVRAL